LIVGGVIAVVVVVRRQRARERELRQLEWQRRIQTLSGLTSITPTQFEHAIGAILTGLGWQVKVVGGSGDLGADLTGRDQHGQRVVVQAKQYTGTSRVGSPAVQLLIGARTIHGSTRAVLVTTADFSTPAYKLARAHSIDLVNGRTLVDLARQSLSRSHASALPDPYDRSGPVPPEGPPDTDMATEEALRSGNPDKDSAIATIPGEHTGPTWDQHHWRTCRTCGTRTRWRDASGTATCQQCQHPG